jgi:hypothetical protein
MDDAAWTLSELVEQASAALERVPAPDNGQVRAVPDERNLRYYTTLGLLDRPAAMRGRTALYGKRHLAQVVAIKRLQTAGKSLAEIQAILATIDNATLSRMSGVALPAAGAKKPARAAFWRTPAATPAPAPVPAPVPVPARVPVPVPLLRISLASGVDLLVDPALAAAAAIDFNALAAAARTLIADLAPTMEDS